MGRVFQVGQCSACTHAIKSAPIKRAKLGPAATTSGKNDRRSTVPPVAGLHRGASSAGALDVPRPVGGAAAPPSSTLATCAPLPVTTVGGGPDPYVFSPQRVEELRTLFGDQIVSVGDGVVFQSRREGGLEYTLARVDVRPMHKDGALVVWLPPPPAEGADFGWVVVEHAGNFVLVEAPPRQGRSEDGSARMSLVQLRAQASAQWPRSTVEALATVPSDAITPDLLEEAPPLGAFHQSLSSLCGCGKLPVRAVCTNPDGNNCDRVYEACYKDRSDATNCRYFSWLSDDGSSAEAQVDLRDKDAAALASRAQAWRRSAFGALATAHGYVYDPAAGTLCAPSGSPRPLAFGRVDDAPKYVLVDKPRYDGCWDRSDRECLVMETDRRISLVCASGGCICLTEVGSEIRHHPDTRADQLKFE